MDLGGVRTAPDHFLGDYPAREVARLRARAAGRPTGKTVLDIGCNGGFYSIEMKRRGAARVLGIDFDDDYLAQARFAAEVTGSTSSSASSRSTTSAALGERFDVVVFMGVLYHLRHPLLALDLIHEHVAGDLLLFQSMQRGSDEIDAVPRPNYRFLRDTALFDSPGYPKLHFVEHATPTTRPTGGCRTRLLGRDAALGRLRDPSRIPRTRSSSAAAATALTGRRLAGRGLSARRAGARAR